MELDRLGVGGEEELAVSSMDPSQHPIRAEAQRFLKMHGFSEPPLPPDQALAARKLEVAQLSLDDMLLKVNLPSADHKKIQAMLDTEMRSVVFKSGLPTQKKNWGSLHEIGHEFIPWQRDFLYCCPLLWLPPHIQKEFEAEADQFAAEAFFFGEMFHKLAFDGDFGLATAKQLATDVYQTSFHVTFTHYVKESPLPRCLLIWRRKGANVASWLSEELEIHYYVKSESFQYHIEPGQVADPDDAVMEVFTNPELDVVSHEMLLVDKTGEQCISHAESFRILTTCSPYYCHQTIGLSIQGGRVR